MRPTATIRLDVSVEGLTFDGSVLSATVYGPGNQLGLPRIGEVLRTDLTRVLRDWAAKNEVIFDNLRLSLTSDWNP